MRATLTTLAELTGMAFVCIGLGMIYLPLMVICLGLALVLVGWLEGSRR